MNMSNEYGSKHTLKSVRKMTGLTQEYFGMIVGMGKLAVSRLEREERKETAIHKELVSLVAFLVGRGLLRDYVRWRFKVNLPRRVFLTNAAKR